MKNQNIGIGKRIKQARTDKGLRQKEIAEKFGLHSASMSKIESGDSSTSVEILLKIKEILNVNLHWILTGEGTPETPTKGIEDEEIIMMLKAFEKSARLKHAVLGALYKYIERFERFEKESNEKEVENKEVKG